MVVYVLKTTSGDGRSLTNEQLAVYKKSSYQIAYNRLADIADRHGVKVWAGDNNLAVQVVCPISGQRWWLERWDCE